MNKTENKRSIVPFLIALLLVALLLIFFRMEEDAWILDKNGIWIEHGHPSRTPDYVQEQQNMFENISMCNYYDMIKCQTGMGLNISCCGEDG